MRKKVFIGIAAVFMLSLASVLAVSCGGGDDDEDRPGSSVSTKVEPLSPMSDVSLGYRATSQVVTLSRDVQSEGAAYRNAPMGTHGLNGLEATKLVYNLEKATGGKDTYKNYPAFAFCIEMNHDPEHHMEWYLPSVDEMRSYAHGQSYSGTPVARHNYWWTSTENSLNGNAYNLFSGSTASRGAVPKAEEWWVVAFRNGKIEV